MPPTYFWPIPLTPKSVFGYLHHHYASATSDHQVAIIPPFVYFGIWNVHWINSNTIYMFFLKKVEKKKCVSGPQFVDFLLVETDLSSMNWHENFMPILGVWSSLRYWPPVCAAVNQITQGCNDRTRWSMSGTIERTKNQQCSNGPIHWVDSWCKNWRVQTYQLVKC